MPTVTAVAKTTRKPGVYATINTAGAKAGLPVLIQKLLLVGTRRSSSSGPSATPTRIYGASEAATYWGSGSPIHRMAIAAFAANPYLSEVWCIALAEDGGGVTASGTIGVAISSLTAGTLALYVGSDTIQIGITASDTANSIAAAINAAINAATDLPFTSTVSTSTVTYTSKVKGTVCNDIGVASDYTGTGLTLTHTGASGGTTDPSVAAAITPATPEQYDVVVSGFNDATNLGLWKTYVEDVSGAMEQRPGSVVAGIDTTLSTVTTRTTGINSGRVVVAYLRGTLTPHFEIAAAFAAVALSEADVARPLNGLEVPWVRPPLSSTDYFTRTEQETLLNNGATPLEIQQGEVRIVRSITTYVQDTFGAADDVLLDWQVIRTLDYIRYVCRSALRSQFSRVKIVDKAVAPNCVDADGIRLFLFGKMKQLEAAGYAERVDDHADRLIVERASDVAGRVDINLPADIADGLHVVAMSVDFIYG